MAQLRPTEQMWLPENQRKWYLKMWNTYIKYSLTIVRKDIYDLKLIVLANKIKEKVPQQVICFAGTWHLWRVCKVKQAQRRALWCQFCNHYTFYQYIKIILPVTNGPCCAIHQNPGYLHLKLSDEFNQEHLLKYYICKIAINILNIFDITIIIIRLLSK